MQKIYIAMHKPYAVPNDALYVPLQVGAEGKKPFGAARDNEGENISEKNPGYCELTGLYWLRCHAEADVVGLVHYRRYFVRRHWRFYQGEKRYLTDADVPRLMEKAELVLPKKRHYWIETTYSHYAHAHHESDLKETRKVIEELCPAYTAAFDETMGRRSGHRFNMLIARRELLQEYCDWLFPLLFELENRLDTSGYDDYNRRVFGFIGERLLDVWLCQRKQPYVECKVLETERPNWLVKGVHFLWRKIRGNRPVSR